MSFLTKWGRGDHMEHRNSSFGSESEFSLERSLKGPGEKQGRFSLLSSLNADSFKSICQILFGYDKIM